MKTVTKHAKGFTLVELLVVITIIGILAMGAIAMFTGAQQKARDSVRITDIQAIKLALEQYYGDEALYPNANATNALAGLTTNGYIDKLPEDPKSQQVSGSGCLVYMYGAADDQTSQVQGQEFELSSSFENQGNKIKKAGGDAGNDPNRWETGVNTDHVNTTIASNSNCGSGSTVGVNKYAGVNADAYIIDK